MNFHYTITVCICTFKRPFLLKKLLDALSLQETRNHFALNVVVVDNDAEQSAKPIIKEIKNENKLDVSYFVEPVQNTARARNKAVENARGDLIAFIDDDEIPSNNVWLLELLQTMEKFDADGALGPVNPSYAEQPPAWVLRGRFHERPTHETGLTLAWHQTRTGNVLLKRSVFENLSFRPEFGCDGEDRDFFRRAIEKGYKFVWCNSAPVLENVPKARWQIRFMLRRAIMRGRKPMFTKKDILISFAAVILYGLILPFSFIKGKHVAIKYLVKSCDHLGRILNAFRINIIKEAYVTEQDTNSQSVI